MCILVHTKAIKLFIPCHTCFSEYFKCRFFCDIPDVKFRKVSLNFMFKKKADFLSWFCFVPIWFDILSEHISNRNAQNTKSF